MIALGITGTSTGVGKTIVACALAAAYVRRGARVGVMKPIETGVARNSSESDSARLAVASRSTDDSATISPYVFPAALAPLVAARHVGQSIELEQLDRAFAAVSASRDVVIVEGAGGLLVPITRDCGFDGLFSRWKLELVIAASNRLGVINHTLLTAQAAARAHLVVRAVVLNETEAAPSDQSTSDNAATLRELLPGIPVLHFPWMPSTNDFDALAGVAESSGLVAAVASR